MIRVEPIHVGSYLALNIACIGATTTAAAAKGEIRRSTFRIDRVFTHHACFYDVYGSRMQVSRGIFTTQHCLIAFVLASFPQRRAWSIAAQNCAAQTELRKRIARCPYGRDGSYGPYRSVATTG